ncbi:glycosyltransferase family 4 protein [Desulfatibacillum aliphaticivorans]|uniref:glycosyltransferase family 4 protein n=1 Tax=Desulfatibacillum aliphaticivorans TaxID=218208 RepID=UPI0003F68515|nr:glycosyltransferase family 4 protein [Desulfatibacillum aliphaticivorans]
MAKKIALVSRCAWTLYNFRAGLMRVLKSQGHEVLGGGARGGGFAAKIRAIGVPFKNLPLDMKGINPVSDIGFFLAMFFWYRKEKPDIAHHFTIKPVIYGSIAARLAGAPKVIAAITGLGYVFTGSGNPLLQSLVEFMYRAAFMCCDHVFFLNPSDMDFFVSKGIIQENKAELLPGEGVDCAHFDGGLFPAPNPEEPPVILMVARLLKDKGIYEYVEAARIAAKKGSNARFCLLGGRDERNPTVVDARDLEEWIKTGVVEWFGETEDVRPFIASASIVVLPSYREGAPRSLMEASAMSRPVVATNVVGCRDVVMDGKTGLLTPLKDSQALAEAILYLLDNPEKAQEMGRQGRSFILNKYSEQIVIDSILKIYDE